MDAPGSCPPGAALGFYLLKWMLPERLLGVRRDPCHLAPNTDRVSFGGVQGAPHFMAIRFTRLEGPVQEERGSRGSIESQVFFPPWVDIEVSGHLGTMRDPQGQRGLRSTQGACGPMGGWTRGLGGFSVCLYLPEKLTWSLPAPFG